MGSSTQLRHSEVEPVRFFLPFRERLMLFDDGVAAVLLQLLQIALLDVVTGGPAAAGLPERRSARPSNRIVRLVLSSNPAYQLFYEFLVVALVFGL